MATGYIMKKGKRSIDRLYRFAQWCKAEKHVKSMNEWEGVCGLGANYLSNTLQSPRGSVGAEVLEKVYRRFPFLNLTYIITGDGDMVPTAEARAEELKKEVKNLEDTIFDLIVRREEMKKGMAYYQRIIDLAEEMKILLKKIPK